MLDDHIVNSEGGAKGQLNQKMATEATPISPVATQSALKLLGCASAYRERRKNAKCMNPPPVYMSEDDALYTTAAPALFRDSFCTRAKEREGRMMG